MAKKSEKDKKTKKVKIVKVTFGIGETKNIGNFESLKIYNELEAAVGEGDTVADIHAQLKDAVLKLNEFDFNTILGK